MDASRDDRAQMDTMFPLRVHFATSPAARGHGRGAFTYLPPGRAEAGTPRAKEHGKRMRGTDCKRPTCSSSADKVAAMIPRRLSGHPSFLSFFLNRVLFHEVEDDEDVCMCVCVGPSCKKRRGGLGAVPFAQSGRHMNRCSVSWRFLFL